MTRAIASHSWFPLQLVARQQEAKGGRTPPGRLAAVLHQRGCAIETFQPDPVGLLALSQGGEMIWRASFHPLSRSHHAPADTPECLQLNAAVSEVEGEIPRERRSVGARFRRACVLVLQSRRLDCAAPSVMANKRNALGIRSCHLAASEEPERMEGTEEEELRLHPCLPRAEIASYSFIELALQ